MLLTDEMRKATFERIFLRDDYLLNPSEQTKIRWNAKSEALRILLESASERFTGTKDSALLQEARKSFDATLSSFSAILEKHKQKEPADRKILAIDEVESTLVRQVFQSAYDLNNNIVKLYELSSRAAIAARNRGIIFIILFVVGGTFAIVINSIFINRIVAKRVSALIKGVEIIGAGNMDYRINVAGDDELSNLARASNEMVEKQKAVQEFSESIINAVREPLIALDQDLRVVKVSRSFYEFFKVKPEETVGQLIYDLGNKQWDIPKLRELLETILPQKTTFDDYEVEHDFATIGKRIMLLNARQIKQVMGRERIILLAIEDITERKAIEAGLEKTRKELEAANKELEAFTYSVSHDLRAPLRGVVGFSRILLDEHAPHLPPEVQRYLSLVLSNTLQMGRLVDDLLAFSHLGRQAMIKDQVKPAALVREAWDLLRSEQDGRHVKLTIGNLPSCQGDRALLKQVFVNLLSNALKFTRKRDPAVIEVGCNRTDGENVFFVRDNGAGFDMRYVGKLFGVFQRLHRSEDYDGTGVGLAIVQRIVHRHGGRVWAEGEPDKGATFYFSLGGIHS
jgi:PAS domain S-box-containing protein